MAECTRCGAKLDDGAAVCGACGLDHSGATAQFEAVGTEDGSAALLDPELLDGPALFVRKGPESGDTFYLDREIVTIGRDPESLIFLNDVTVSRSHAVIEIDSGDVVVRDAGSLNGTYVNGECVEHAELRNGDVLQIGSFQMVFTTPGGLA